MTDTKNQQLLSKPPLITDDALKNPEHATCIQLDVMILLDLQGHQADELAEQLRSAAPGIFQGPLSLVQTEPAEPLGYYADCVVDAHRRRTSLEANWTAKLADQELTHQEVASLITRAGLMSITEFVNQSLKKSPPESTRSDE